MVYVLFSALKGILHCGGSSEETTPWEVYQTLGQSRRDEPGGGRNNITFCFLIYGFFFFSSSKVQAHCISKVTLAIGALPSAFGFHQNKLDKRQNIRALRSETLMTARKVAALEPQKSDRDKERVRRSQPSHSIFPPLLPTLWRAASRATFICKWLLIG